jgi:hypothetical protein
MVSLEQQWSERLKVQVNVVRDVKRNTMMRFLCSSRYLEATKNLINISTHQIPPLPAWAITDHFE